VNVQFYPLATRIIMNDPQILSGASAVKFGSEYYCGCQSKCWVSCECCIRWGIES